MCDYCTQFLPKTVVKKISFRELKIKKVKFLTQSPTKIFCISVFNIGGCLTFRPFLTLIKKTIYLYLYLSISIYISIYLCIYISNIYIYIYIYTYIKTHQIDFFKINFSKLKQAEKLICSN